MPNYFVLKNLVDTVFPKRNKKSKNAKSVVPPGSDCDEDDLPLSKIIKTEDCQKDSKTCRICLKKGSLKIFDNRKREDKATHIKEIADVEVLECDNFPKYMCEPCNTLLESAIVFRKTCQDSDKMLRDAASQAEFDEMMQLVKEEYKIHNETDFSDHSLGPINDDDVPCEEIKPHAEDSDKKYNLRVAITPIAKSVLKVEVKSEKIPSSYACEKCHINFSSNAELTRHKRTPEHKSAMDKCPVCKLEMTGSYIKTHIRRVHTIERPYICDVCGKGFAQEAAFRRHAAIHTDDLPYKCPQCPYKGRFRESVRIHMRTHTGERPFACAECPMTFATKSNLNRHSRQHKNGYPHECKECQRGFYTTTELQRHHKVVHSGIKDFPCNICGKEFGWRKEMKKHQRRVHHVAKCPRKGREPLYLKLEKKIQNSQHCYEQEIIAMHG